MKQLLLVFLGGGAGSVLRYLVSRYLNAGDGIPLGTFAVNVLGSLFIGLILGILWKSQSLSENTTLLLATGFCGGFTTFSAFAFENQLLLKSGDYLSALFYIAGSIVVGIGAVFLGMFLVR